MITKRDTQTPHQHNDFMVPCGFSWLQVGFHGFYDARLVFHGFSWFHVGFHGSRWIFMLFFFRAQVGLMIFHGSRCVFMGFHGSRWVFMVFHNFVGNEPKKNGEKLKKMEKS